MDLNILITFGAAVAGVAVGYGTIKATQTSQAIRLKKLESWKTQFTGGGNPNGNPAYVRRTECALVHSTLAKRLTEGAEKMEEHARALRGLQGFARHMLQKDGMPLHEINDIIDGKE